MTRLIILAILTGCGTASPADKQTGEIDQAPSINGEEEPMINTLAVTSRDLLPACSEKNNNQLVYVKDIRSFFACENTQWALIEGVATSGKDGKNGEAGKDGTNGKDLRSTPNLWYDIITKNLWIMHSSLAVAWNTPDFNTLCPSGFRAPSKEELEAAGQNGLYISMKAALGTAHTESYTTSKGDFTYNGDLASLTYIVKFTPGVSSALNTRTYFYLGMDRNVSLYCLRPE